MASFAVHKDNFYSCTDNNCQIYTVTVVSRTQKKTIFRFYYVTHLAAAKQQHSENFHSSLIFDAVPFLCSYSFYASLSSWRTVLNSHVSVSGQRVLFVLLEYYFYEFANTLFRSYRYSMFVYENINLSIFRINFILVVLLLSAFELFRYNKFIRILLRENC